MERLTEINKVRCDVCYANEDGVCLFPNTFPCNDYKIYQRLAEIEDVLGDDYNLERLKELVEADKEGRCKIMPCKIGDTINMLILDTEKRLQVITDKVTSVTYNKNGWTVKTKSKFYPIREKDGYTFAKVSEYPHAMADYYIGNFDEL